MAPSALSFHLVSSPARLLSNPAPQVQAVTRETGTVFCSFHSTPSKPCKRFSHVTGKNTTVELCLLMRIAGPRGGSPVLASARGLPIGLPPPPGLWVSGAGDAWSPQTAGSHRPIGEKDRILQMWRLREQFAMATQGKAKSAQAQPDFCLLGG